jgi:DNA-binding MarR family transcriptional regulator
MDPPNLENWRTYEFGLIQAQAYRAITTSMASSLQGFGLSMIEWGILGKICDTSGLRVSEIAYLASVEVPRIVFLTKRLEAKGYVARAVTSADRRAVVIVATELGRTSRDAIESQVKAHLGHFLAGIKPKDLMIYFKVIRFLSAKLYR